ncbi:thioesterase family protein [Bordetella sp. LUAb4]|uniref:acyl-CoA thioesterase n=1 Tax=Bordetella sp. LUAb4 TaxID=2843195 RepID=UPI001E65A53E|nr:thioesterase family protein [Bordetella sp. LUAb4]
MLKIIDDGGPLSAPLHIAHVNVRWGDLDADGHVNNATLLAYVEEARMQWSGRLALQRCAPALMSVVVSQACTYHAPIGYPTCLAVTLHCGHIGNSSVGLIFDLRDTGDAGQNGGRTGDSNGDSNKDSNGCPDERHYATAAITWVWVDRQDKRPRPMPTALRAACTAAFIPIEPGTSNDDL